MHSFHPLGDSAIIVHFDGDSSSEIHGKIVSLASMLQGSELDGFLEAVPSYTTLTIHYNPLLIGKDDPYEYVCRQVDLLIKKLPAHTDLAGRQVDIPVCYGGDFGPDLDYVASYHNLSVQEVIAIHMEPIYPVYFLGFSPGFPYLGGLLPKLETPRKETPRKTIPKGSVGIAGRQTGIYPLGSPGGWQIIGQTPLRLFSINQDSPALLQPGDNIRFYPISRQQFMDWGKEDGN
ncbi:inhibitor of KinA [Salirhabdus euzebyi]|uniref:Inhibitor of KinA n=1 Tax=Salirhabdus euzebyi TaxID=394506 RepID=A0A841Q5P3_9BACI|nr:5-oxoprolinase subunit PxpB [Salirhabdus euzebyi]MBB6453642.1 inhibitor of KinA [Salirhabdus euzebyi]